MLTLNALLQADGVAPADVTLLFHTPRTAQTRALLPFLAAERADLFDAYQSVHALPAQRTLDQRPLVASFVALADHMMALVGVYRIAAKDLLPRDVIYADPCLRTLSTDFGAHDVGPEANLVQGGDQIRFTLEKTTHLSDLQGRLVVNRPTGRTYARVAAQVTVPVVQITEESILIQPQTDWRRLVMTGPQIRALPQSWAVPLAQWRGVYLIVDETDGARYVGSAYGAANLLGRWRAHVAGDRGITAELQHRNPADFRFSILERVSPDMPADDVIGLERTWMERLHVLKYGLNS